MRPASMTKYACLPNGVSRGVSPHFGMAAQSTSFGKTVRNSVKYRPPAISSSVASENGVKHLPNGETRNVLSKAPPKKPRALEGSPRIVARANKSYYGSLYEYRGFTNSVMEEDLPSGAIALSESVTRQRSFG